MDDAHGVDGDHEEESPHGDQGHGHGDDQADDDKDDEHHNP